MPAEIIPIISTILNGDLSGALTMLRHHANLVGESAWVTAVDRIIVNEWIRRRQSKEGALQRLKSLGFSPNTVIDVGAQVGTPELFNAFPEARHLFIEPVAECLPHLQAIKQRLKQCEIENVAISNTNGQSTLSISESLQYSSLEGASGPIVRTIEVRTVNYLIEKHILRAPYLLKIDVDGREIDVLKGATSVLNDPNSCLVIEATLCDKTPRFQRIIDFLERFNYRVSDIVDYLYRPNDQALWQVDLIALRESHVLFGKTDYA